MARKKVVFIIVEGPSDQDALEMLLKKKSIHWRGTQTLVFA